MAILRHILERLDKTLDFPVAYAHCDIPCGIYDPHAMQMAAHTVVRMDMLIADVAKGGGSSAEDRNKLIRYVKVKEEHAELCKNEIKTLWGDYFKPEHAKAHPELSELVWNALKSASKAKQTADIKNAEELLENTERIAEIFWNTKSVKTKRVKSFYPSEHEMVYPVV